MKENQTGVCIHNLAGPVTLAGKWVAIYIELE